jgi:signal transduction histidine kinase
MKCRVKQGITTGTGKNKVKIPKNQIGIIKSLISGDIKRAFPDLDYKPDGFFYLVDFPEAKDLIIPTRDVDLE